MAEITAKLVNELRAKTGQPMMECKKMLTQTGGDMEAAIGEFRKKGIKSSLAERSATEGRVGGVAVADGSAAALVELNCNTDFTAKSEPFLKLATKAAQQYLHHPDADIAQAGDGQRRRRRGQPADGRERRRRQVGLPQGPRRRQGRACTCTASPARSASSWRSPARPSEDLVKQVGGHIAFARPAGLTRDAVDPALVAKEREIAVEAAKATGKPQQIAEKIAEGKLNAFFGERVLLDQEFFNAGVFKGTVANYLKRRSVTLTKYVRIEVGQA